MAEELKYLGFIFTRDGIRSDPKKIEAIQSLVQPKNRRELRSFLGICNYLRKGLASLDIHMMLLH